MTKGTPTLMTLPPPVSEVTYAQVVMCPACRELVTVPFVASVHVTPSLDGGSLFTLIPTHPTSTRHDCGAAAERAATLATHVHVYKPPTRDWDEPYDRDEEIG